MSQAPQSAPAPAVAAPPPTPGQAAATPVVATGPGAFPTVAVAAVAAATPKNPASDTAGRLRSLTVLMIITGVVFGIVSGLVFARLAYGMSRAEDSTTQLIRVQQIQSNLLRADATATNAFLVGGLEPAEQRATYDTSITATSTLIAEAADAQPADARALAVLNTAVVNYVATVERARANNRQGLPVGSQYLRNASADLRADALPVLANLNRANQERALSEMSSHLQWVLLVVGLLALVSVGLTMRWVAHRFRRRLNVGLAASAGVLVVSLVLGMIILSTVIRQTNDIAATSFASVTAAADVRISGNDAKSNESLTLIARGSGAAFEKAWVVSAAVVDDQLGAAGSDTLPQLWQGYTTVHTKIRALDDAGQWDQAVVLATGTGADSSNATFAAFDAEATAAIDVASATTSDSLRSPQTGLVVGSMVFLLLGLGSAVLARWGLAQRLKEYR